MKTGSRFGRREVRQMLYAVLAAILCFIGPTYFVAAMSEITSQVYASVVGFVCFLIGIWFVFKLVKE